MDSEDYQAIKEKWKAYYEAESISSAVEDLKFKTFSLRGAGIVLYMALIAISFLFATLAYSSTVSPFLESLWIELSAGVALFVLAPPVLLLIRIYGLWFVIYVLLFSLSLATIGFLKTGVTRSLLIEASVGILFITALDLFINSWLKSIEENVRIARAKINENLQKREEAVTKMESAENFLDDKYAALDYFGLGFFRPDQLGSMGILNLEDENNDFGEPVSNMISILSYSAASRARPDAHEIKKKSEKTGLEATEKSDPIPGNED